jgi:hypothetical protein
VRLLITRSVPAITLDVPLCYPDDPIEPGNTSCTLDANSAYVLDRKIPLRSGTWTAVATVTDANGAKGTAERTFVVADGSLPPTGPVAISGLSRTRGAAGLVLRGPPSVKLLSGDTLTILGQNLHNNPYIDAYLSPRGLAMDETLAPGSGLPVAKWCRYPLAILGRGERDGVSFLTVRLEPLPPEVRWNCTPGSTGTMGIFRTEWRVLLDDHWIRPAREAEWVGYPDLHKPYAAREPYLRLTRPVYPLVDGFGFKNADTDPTLDEFLAVYGMNAYICVGFIKCLTHVPDPMYWSVWFATYYLIMDGIDGSCVGMSATSLLFRTGALQPEQFDSATHFPAGFTQRDPAAVFTGPWHRLTGPPKPGNLWARIRVNHGVQLSREVLQEAVQQLSWNGGSVSGSPSSRLDELGSPTSLTRVLSMLDLGDGKGHNVLPYAVVGDDIRVYDNNYPEDSTRVVVVNRTNDTYRFDHKTDDVWTGSGLFTLPIDIWRHGRHAPLDLDGLLLSIVAGDADGTAGTPAGRVGRRSDGRLVQSLPGAVVVPFAGAGDSAAPVVAMVPVRAGPLEVTVDPHGPDYLYTAAQGETVMQVQVHGAVAGASDAFALGYDADRLSRLEINPASAGATIVPVVALTPGVRQRALFRWVGLTGAQGGRAVLVGDPARRSVEYVNRSGSSATFRLVVQTADGASGAQSNMIFGPVTVPAGARLRSEIADWPRSTVLQMALDRNNDGTAETTGRLTGETCNSPDHNQNGMPDRCELGSAYDFRHHH